MSTKINQFTGVEKDDSIMELTLQSQRYGCNDYRSISHNGGHQLRGELIE